MEISTIRKSFGVGETHALSCISIALSDLEKYRSLRVVSDVYVGGFAVSRLLTCVRKEQEIDPSSA